MEQFRRIGFWIDEADAAALGQLTASLVSDSALVTSAIMRRYGSRWHARIELARMPTMARVFHSETGKLTTLRIYPRQRRDTIQRLPPLLVWRLCKDRRWHTPFAEFQSSIESVAGTLTGYLRKG